MKTLLVAGTRPNFIKIAPLLDAARRHPQMEITLVHTGQHYNYEMSRAFFQQLGIREPDIFLEVGSGSHAWQTAEIMIRLEAILTEAAPDIVVLVGDVNSTLAGALAAAKARCGGGGGPLIAHVESGLRSFDRSMPEEINRVLTDRLSDYLFTTCADAEENLLREGIPPERIHFVGNVMIDTLLKNMDSITTPPLLEGCDGEYALLTLHRPSNVDDPATLKDILDALAEVAVDVPVIFPAHPRTRNQLRTFDLECLLSFPEDRGRPSRGCIYLIEALPYLEFVGAMKSARLVLTDSGGIQEETTVLGIPCLTLRKNTERPITVKIGTNTIVGTDREKIVSETRRILGGSIGAPRIPDLWDGRAAGRILDILAPE